MDHFDPRNAYLAIGSNILKTVYVAQGHIYIYIYIYIYIIFLLDDISLLFI